MEPKTITRAAKIRLQIANGRKTFQKRLLDPKYKQEHVHKILCSGNTHDTKPEKEVRTILELTGIKYIRQYQVKDKVFDFYIPSLNLLIEVDGVYWHGKDLTEETMNSMQKKHKINDNKKNDLARSEGYNLERVWEDETEKNAVTERIMNYAK